MHRIVLVGFQSSGKNTAGEYLVSKYGFAGLSFADSLKDAVSSIFCWDRRLLEGVTGESRKWRETVDEWWAEKLGVPGLTPRWVLRNFGTDVMRNHFNENIWIANVERRILDLGDTPVVVFDGRFPNEIGMVRSVGGKAIRVKRGPEPDWFNLAFVANSSTPHAETAREILDKKEIHPSEYSWIGTKLDAVLYNESDLDSLYAQIDQYMGDI